MVEARLRLAGGDVRGALASANRAVMLDPDDAEALLAWADAFRTAGHTRIAIQDLGQALQSRPRFILVLGARGDLFAFLNETRLARAGYEDAISAAPPGSPVGEEIRRRVPAEPPRGPGTS